MFNTPSHHRVHHARNPRYLDRNYAGVLIIWDRLFKTFEPERAEEPVRYGVVKNLGDFNILRVSFHEWAAIGRDLWRDPKNALGYIFGPAGLEPRRLAPDLGGDQGRVAGADVGVLGGFRRISRRICAGVRWTWPQAG